MLEALRFGLLASSGLVLGSLIGGFFRLPRRLLVVLLAFASGTLITAVSVELFADAFEQGGPLTASLGLLAGAVVFVWSTTGSTAGPDVSPARAGGTAGFTLVAAVTLDGVPENLALGISLVGEGGGIVLLAAIFLSNFPEALVGTAAMRAQGRPAGSAIWIWCIVAVGLTVAVVAGRVLLARVPEAVAFPLAFAGGAVLASLADTLMPDAYRDGGPAGALATAGGFLVAFLLSAL